MPTLHQLGVRGRRHKRRRSLVAALAGAPMRRAIILKMAITTPRKPNSAKRRYAKIRILFNEKVVHAKIPGTGLPGIQEYSNVMVEGGSPPDTPGVNYTLIRGLLDFDKDETCTRTKKRSKYGRKQPLSAKPDIK
jgi:small subunit ribosomal protein S12